MKQIKDIAPGWLPVVVTALLLLPFYSTLGELWVVWQDPAEPYAHGMLMALLTVYVFSQSNIAEYRLSAVEQCLCVGAMTGGLALWALGTFLFIDIFCFVALPAIVLSSVYLIFGRAMLVSVLFGGVFYGLSIPLWGVLVPILQALTVLLAGGMAELTGVNAYINGIYVHLSAGILAVEGGCAGLNYFLAGISLTFVMAYMRGLNLVATAIVVVIAITLSMVANWVRVYLLIVIADVTDMQHYLIQVSHSKFGWVVFGALFFPFLFVGMRYRGFKERPNVIGNPFDGSLSNQRFVITCALLLILVTVFTFTVRRWQSPVNESVLTTIDLKGGISLTRPALSLAVNAPDAQQHWRYFSKNASYQVSVYSYVNETRRRHVLEYFNRPFEGHVYTSRQIISLPSGAYLTAARVSAEGKNFAVLSGYKIGKNIVATRGAARTLRADNLGYRDGVNAFIAIYRECDSDCDQVLQDDFENKRDELDKLVSKIVN